MALESEKEINREHLIDDADVDWFKLINHVRTKFKTIAVCILISASLGIVTSLLMRVEFTSSCSLLPELNNSSIDLGGLGGLAGLAGVNLSSIQGGQVLVPELYPQIVSSTGFIQNIASMPIYYERLDTTLSSFHYFKFVQKETFGELMYSWTFGIIGKVKSLIGVDGTIMSDHGFYRFDYEDWLILENIRERIDVVVDRKTGIIYIETKMPDPVASANLTKAVVNDLTKQVIDYRIEKARNHLIFVKESFLTAEKNYKEKQGEYTKFLESNLYMKSALISTQNQFLKNELDVAFEIYRSLASQLEQAKISLMDETPAFTTIHPIIIPPKKSEPKRVLIVFSFAFLGLFGSVIAVVIGFLSRYGLVSSKR